MILDFKDDLELKRIADSGQCFRWVRISDEGDPAAYRIIAGGRVLFICNGKEGAFDLSCDRESFDGFWKKYLDLDTDYRAIRESVNKNDLYLNAAAEKGRGIRILCQDPFEALISFIISQRKNIPSIKSSIERLCEKAGKKIGLSAPGKQWLKDHSIPEEYGKDLYAFPSPEELALIPAEDLASCGTGYRAPYIRKAAEDVLSGTIDLKAMAVLNDEELLQELMKIYGVGKKVASCTALFGFHRLDFFPVDVWIDRVLKTHYPDGFPFGDYAPYNGVMQQYMFYRKI